jgi:hypothetical protein
VFTHLVDHAGGVRGGHDGIPAGGARPTSGWLAGEVVTDAHELRLDAGAPPGEYTLAVGLYDAASGLRLPLLGADGQAAADAAILQAVALEGP